MNTVQHRASLHEKSVQAVARGAVKRARRRSPELRRRVLDARYTKVHPTIWKLVRENDIDHLRVEVRDNDAIIIWNHRQPWPEV